MGCGNAGNELPQFFKFHKYVVTWRESPHIWWGKGSGWLVNWKYQKKAATGKNRRKGDCCKVRQEGRDYQKISKNIRRITG